MHRPAQPVAAIEACVPNIGGSGRRRRMRGGLAYLVLGLLLSTVMVVLGTRWWVWPLLALIYARSALGVFQAREKTWVVLASRGLRELDDGVTTQRLEQEFLVAVRRQARSVWVQTAVAAVVLTTLTWVAATVE